MHVVRVRPFGVLAALTALAVVASAPACSSPRAETSGGGDAAQHTGPGAATLPSHAGSPSHVASGANGDAGTSPGEPAGAADDADAGAAAADADAAADAGAGAPVELAPFHVVGRFDARDPAGPRFGWPGTELRARFSGASLSVVLGDTGASYYDVSIDGGAAAPLVTSAGTQTYLLASGLANGEHDVVITRRTETITGVTQLLGFVGVLVPTPAPTGRRLELVGDSITCGYGVLGLSQACAFSASTEDEPKAWGAVAARQLGAMHMVTAVSGMGLIRNFGGETIGTMPERYDRALADDPSSTWDPHAFEPDVIVVDLGTNDFNDGKGDPGPAFQAKYTTFLATLRARHPQAHIFAATSPMLTGQDRVTLRSYVSGAVAARQLAGDAKVSWFEIDQQSEADGYGCDFHPSVTTQQKMAAALVAQVKSHMGW